MMASLVIVWGRAFPKSFLVIISCCVVSSGGLRADSSIELTSSLSDFSATQGHEGWYYGFYDGDVPQNTFLNDDFEQLPIFSDGHWKGSGESWTMVNGSQQHPGNTHWVVRRWVSPFAGEFSLNWHVDAHESQVAGDGVNAYVISNNETLWSDYIPTGDTVGVNASMTVPLYAGEAIDFAVSPRGNNHMDSTEYHIAVAYVPEPGTIVILLTAAAGLLLYRKRR